jgi:hypothetical protein
MSEKIAFAFLLCPNLLAIWITSWEYVEQSNELKKQIIRVSS